MRHKSITLCHSHGPLPHHLSYVSLWSRLLAVVGLNKKCPPQDGASEHSVLSWWHCLGRFIWGSLSGGSLPWVGVGFESLKLSLLPFLLAGCHMIVVGTSSPPRALIHHDACSHASQAQWVLFSQEPQIQLNSSISCPGPGILSQQHKGS